MSGGFGGQTPQTGIQLNPFGSRPNYGWGQSSSSGQNGLFGRIKADCRPKVRRSGYRDKNSLQSTLNDPDPNGDAVLVVSPRSTFANTNENLCLHRPRQIQQPARFPHPDRLRKIVIRETMTENPGSESHRNIWLWLPCISKRCLLPNGAKAKDSALTDRWSWKCQTRIRMHYWLYWTSYTCAEEAFLALWVWNCWQSWLSWPTTSNVTKPLSLIQRYGRIT